MICSKIFTPKLFHAKNIIPRIGKSNINVFNFSNFKLPLPTDIDSANITGLLSANQAPYMNFWEKVAQFKFTSMYSGLDQFSRQFLFTVANEWGLGLPCGIIFTSLLIRMMFFYPGIKAQLNGMKMKQIKPQMQRFQQKMKAAQMSRNKSLSAQAQKEWQQVLKQRNIDNFVVVTNLIQIPFLITWFLSLRYITNLPQVFTQLQTQPFLWMKDLSAYDPYFILPLVAAFVTSASIIYSPSLNKQNTQMAFMVPLIKYLKFLPFISLPVTAMFPAAINIYWVTISFVQLATVGVLNTNYFKRQVGLIQKIQKQKTIQAVFVQQKRSQNQSNKNNQVFNLKSSQTGPVQTIKILSSKPKKQKKLKE